jgi:hypothetical protein
LEKLCQARWLFALPRKWLPLKIFCCCGDVDILVEAKSTDVMTAMRCKIALADHFDLEVDLVVGSGAQADSSNCKGDRGSSQMREILKLIECTVIEKNAAGLVLRRGTNSTCAGRCSGRWPERQFQLSNHQEDTGPEGPASLLPDAGFFL